MNFALAHVLGATLQTALFNAPLVVIVGWGLGKKMVRTSFCPIIKVSLIFLGFEFSDFRCSSFDPKYHCRRKLPPGRQIQLP
jgi:uncharacterized membrane-anchored protein YitT (DUF2179 family)